MYSDIRKSVEDLLLYKGKLIKNAKGYRLYIQERLKEHSITDPEEAFVMGAVDGMIYDLGSAMDFTKQKGKTFDVTAYVYRKEIIKKLWGKK